MRSFLLVALLCAGCSASADVKVPTDFNPMVGKGTVQHESKSALRPTYLT